MARHLQVWVWASFAAVVLCSEQRPAPSLASSSDSIDADETVIIRSPDSESVHIGAGVIVGRDGGRLLIATAAHVLSSKAPTVQLSSGDELGVTKVERVPGFDLALLETDWYSGFARVAVAGTPALGEDVHVWGHRLRHDYVESGAQIVDLDPALPEGIANGRFAIDCAACDHGDSGGGVFDDAGRLLGILEGARRDRSGSIVFVEVEPIQPLEAQKKMLVAVE